MSLLQLTEKVIDKEAKDEDLQVLGGRKTTNDVIRGHDDLTGVNYRQPLA